MDDQKLKDQIKELLLNNTETGYSKLLDHHYCYIKPSPSKYPFQWWWDTFFHVYILCALDEYNLAKRNISSLFAFQRKDGFIGHMVYWRRRLPKTIFNILEAKPTFKQLRPHMSSLIQPTLAAQALERIYQGDKDEEYLRQMLPKVKKYHDWLIKNRDFDGDGLISIITPQESGIDWKPSYDSMLGFKGDIGNINLFVLSIWLGLKNFVKRYNLEKIKKANDFIAKDACFNTIYALDLRALSRLYKAIGQNDTADYYEKRAEKVGKRIMEIMYDEEQKAFFDTQGPENKKLKVLTGTIFFPIVLPEVPIEISKKVIEAHLLNPAEFNLQYPIPSVAATEKSFVPGENKTIFNFELIWRGSTWVFYNWFLYKCLASKGFVQHAYKLLQVTYSLIEIGGFREYYNPHTGQGYGAKNFTWSGLILDMIAHDPNQLKKSQDQL